jgi:hypothetical protein
MAAKLEELAAATDPGPEDASNRYDARIRRRKRR